MNHTSVGAQFDTDAKKPTFLHLVDAWIDFSNTRKSCSISCSLVMWTGISHRFFTRISYIKTQVIQCWAGRCPDQNAVQSSDALSENIPRYFYTSASRFLQVCGFGQIYSPELIVCELEIALPWFWRRSVHSFFRCCHVSFWLYVYQPDIYGSKHTMHTRPCKWRKRRMEQGRKELKKGSTLRQAWTSGTSPPWSSIMHCRRLRSYWENSLWRASRSVSAAQISW